MNNEKDNREAVKKNFPLRARFEYWFDNRKEVEKWKTALNSIFND